MKFWTGWRRMKRWMMRMIMMIFTRIRFYRYITFCRFILISLEDLRILERRYSLRKICDIY